MAIVLQARKTTLQDLRENFGLDLERDLSFFPEWQGESTPLSEAEVAFLDRVQAGYFNLLNYPPLLEKSIQIAVVGPLLFLAGYFLPPFHIRTEHSVEITAEDEGITIRGQIDILLAKEQFWVAAIESKEAEFSVEAGLAQLLSYMLANPDRSKSGFGLIAAGGGFTFVKLQAGAQPKYATSKVFEVRNPGNELYDVFRILRSLAESE